MKSHIKGLLGEKWDILPNGFLTAESLTKLQKGKEETARNLKELGVADDIIMKSTGLSKEEIEKL